MGDNLPVPTLRDTSAEGNDPYAANVSSQSEAGFFESGNYEPSQEDILP